MVRVSSGASVRGSMTSTETPSPASVSAAASAARIPPETPTAVTSVPGRRTAARPIGTR